MSANLVVDIGNTCISQPSIAVGSGLANCASGAIVGASVNLNNADTYCNLMVAGTLVNGSGQLRIQVQSSDSDVSGTYVDCTSGLAQFPSSFASGGLLFINSGALGSGVLNTGNSGQNAQSGFVVFAGFQRPGTFVRAVALSGDFYTGPLFAAFLSQQRTTGSGGGFSYSPASSGNQNIQV